MDDLFLLLCFAAIVLMVAFIVITIKEKDRLKKKASRKKWLICLAVAIISFVLFGATTDTTTSENSGQQNQTAQETESIEEAKPLYADAEIVDLMSGSGKNVIGTITVTHAKKADCTEEALTDWLFNYVLNNGDSKYHVIVYDDVEGKGVYTTGLAMVYTDIALEEDKDGSYSIGNDAGSTMYMIDSEGKTITKHMTMASEETVESVKSAVNEVIPDEYKTSEAYYIDVAGEEGGKLDCNLTLVNEQFEDADYQTIAMELATKIKGLDLGIGYFCIAFQSDDVTMKALSSLNDLSTQDVSEMSTNLF